MAAGKAFKVGWRASLSHAVCVPLLDLHRPLLTGSLLVTSWLSHLVTVLLCQ